MVLSWWMHNIESSLIENEILKDIIDYMTFNMIIQYLRCMKLVHKSICFIATFSLLMLNLYFFDSIFI